MKRRSVCLATIVATVAAGSVFARTDIELPQCGILVGHAVYNYHGLFPGGYGNWIVQRGNPFEIIDRTAKEDLLFNVDFVKPHSFDLHFNGKTTKITLNPQELLRVKKAN